MGNPKFPFIRAPVNPFWEVFKTFGRDELTGGGLALVATISLEGVFYLYSGSNYSPTQLLWLALAGPILEKIGFFFWHFVEANNVYKTTPENERSSYDYYLIKAVQGGGKTLLWDIILHDPLYIFLMMMGMSIHPATPVWILVPIAFAMSVIGVTVVEVAFNEFRYWCFKRTKHNEGFTLEQYLDARFYLAPEVNPDEALRNLASKFLPKNKTVMREYTDNYYPVNLPEYNGREGKLRLRKRDRDDGTSVITMQYIYTRTVENKTPVGQFRYYPRKKDKHYKILEEKTAKTLAKQEAKHAGGANRKPTQLKFSRHVIYDPEKLFISIDSVDNTYHVIEVKAYPSREQALIKVMRYIMRNFLALQTTHSKLELLD